MAEPGPAESVAAASREPLLLGESELVLPPDGDTDARPSIHSAMGRLRGHATGWQWAFLCAFVFDDLSRRSSAALHTLALFDLEKGEYGTSTEYDRPGLLRRRRAQRSSPSRGRLDLSFQGSRGESFWRAHEAGDGRIAPLGSLLRAVGADDDGRFMQLDLELDARKPALPLDDYAQPGAPLTGQPGARGYFQSGVRFSGGARLGR